MVGHPCMNPNSTNNGYKHVRRTEATENHPMTNDKWQEIVSYVLGRLENESEFDIDKERFFEHFGLESSDDIDFLMKRDYPRERHFQMKTVEFQSRLVFVFSRLEVTK